ncbi:DUF1887 family CARF protein [Bacteroides sp. OttesenSCG-928-E20]|nr:DUF1887 family CARF protein [Bacteroides sp. OttesenSCG-928-N06]MDL2299159.1 DUF1887 family CARF protein [Bacteroides sp. OttesenSCG-928-E20]MDL2304646.1 DUF1887 family CARF protein [Bacteroides sp. OttesenSCG-928-D19]
MSKIHIALVGGQTIPVYMGILDVHPDRVLLVYSEQTPQEAKRIQDVVGLNHPEIVFEESLKLDPVELAEIYRKAETCFAQMDEADELSVNISGGTKSWTLAFFDVFKRRASTTLFYVDQNNNCWNLITHKKHQITETLNIDTRLRLYGNVLEEYTKFTVLTTDDLNCAKSIRRLRRKHPGVFNKLIKYENAGTKLPNDSSITWNEDKTAAEVVMKTPKFSVKEKLKSKLLPDMLLNTGWFEIEVANLISRWGKAREIWINCVFKAKDTMTKNEIDMIVDTGTKLLFVECKTQIFDTTAIDKFKSAVSNYSGMSSMAILITDAPLNERSIEKCDDNKILHFSLNQGSSLLPADKLLFALLDNKLFNIKP